MQKYSKEDIYRMVEEEDVAFIRLQFTDMFGTLKNIAISPRQLEKALNNECMFDGSAISGFLRIDETDMYLYPDINTFEIFPWHAQQGKTARLLCDVYTSDRKPFKGDPRYILKQVIERAAERGYTFQVGPECEFFLFHTDEEGRPTLITHENAGYFDLSPLDLGENARRDMVLTLEDMGFEIKCSHHEAAPAQHEIDFKYSEALSAADDMVTMKMVIKTIAKRHGVHATFMPKPKQDTYGSGMHINMSVNKNGVNIFQNPDDSRGLSEEAYYFIGGLLKHMKAITLIVNPLVNSYKRLVPGYDAPIYMSWNKKNNSPLIKVPVSKGEGTRIELRNPDPSANPYLAFAVCLAAGLEGIASKTLPPKELQGNVLTMSQEERDRLGIERLPRSLGEAIVEFEKDTFIQEVLGEELSQKYLAAKKEEYRAYHNNISQWEIQEYLYRI